MTILVKAINSLFYAMREFAKEMGLLYLSMFLIMRIWNHNMYLGMLFIIFILIDTILNYLEGEEL